MKIEPSSPGGRAGAAARVKRPAAEAIPEPAAEAATASILGIPEEEFTPSVRAAVMALMQEVDSLRRELAQTRARLGAAEELADRDHLVPLLGRRAFVRELTRYIAFTGRTSMPASLLYFDLDRLKAVNDAHGHAAGDAVLTHFSEVLLSQVREGDSVGRLGGDEFGVLLTCAGREQALKKADRLAATLQERPATWNGRTIPVSFSCGAFELKPGDTAETALARADAAMYAHKRAARTAAE